MKYVPPFTSVDPNAPYVNGNPSSGTKGSIPPAEAFEHPMREIMKVIEDAGLDPDEADLTQLWQAINILIGIGVAGGNTAFATLAELRAALVSGKAVDPAKLAAVIQENRWISGVAGGTANALTVTLAPAPTALSAGMLAWVYTGATPNTGAATLNENALGVKSILRVDGSPLQSGDLPASTPVPLYYDGAAWRNLIAGGPNAQPKGQMTWAVAGTYSFVVPAGVYLVYAKVWGAGGGGGGAQYTSARAAAMGGAGGAYAERYIPVTPGQTLAIVIGGGGSGGSASGGNGGQGGSSSVAGSVIAPGGSGGVGATDTLAGGSVPGGVATTGTVNIAGNPGGGVIDTGGSPVSGAGGSSYTFPGYGNGNQGSAGAAAGQPGCGGNGGSRGSAGTAAGGAGAAGFVVISY
ncbi:hypothetical protein OSH11_17085 [Kaistia dalseonensis]|uniref:Glycine-rich domain-containing protein n=1 Tax=Kaistia dalseonensis TaxID=410840 RepID=A0ABU0H9P8_9HYPH|nr:hypothetical protein [Kaistia dalseonensis]MCX5496424.1 hypothetical protein [Kaistia dalseonensis]MDQ0439044.1 hypothetical protein [Kaistia dalseonensis]